MMTTVKEGYVKTEFHQGITTIEFFHPLSNSLPGRLLEELAMPYTAPVMMNIQR